MKSAKVALAVVLLIVAGVIFWWTNWSGEAGPQADDSRTAWKCLDCGHVFELTSAEAADAAVKAGAYSPLHCVSCGQLKAFRVATCLVCGTYYFSSDVPGQSGACPVCNPDKRPADDPIVEDESEPREESPPAV